MPNDFKIPFNSSYVLSVTLRNMRSAIDLSTRKTIGRLPDFNGDQTKTAEILNTLASLERLHQLLNTVIENNPQLFDTVEN